MPKPHRSVTDAAIFLEFITLSAEKQGKKKGVGLKKPTPFPISMHRAWLIIRFYLFFRNIAVFKAFNLFDAVQPVFCLSVITKGADSYAVC